MKNKVLDASLKFYVCQEFAMLPIVLYIVLSGVIMIFFHYYSMKALIIAAIISIFIGFLLCKTKSEYWNSIVRGLAKYSNARLILIFMVIGIFSNLLVTGKIGAGFIWLSLHLGIKGGGFAVFCFIVSSIISMGAGAPIAALLAVVPIFYPAGVLMGANPAVLVGAMMSGIFFGDALSPSSQVIHTTIISQHDPVTGESAKLIETLKERLVYILIAGALSAFMFFIFGGGGSTGNVSELINMADIKGLWMLFTIAVLLIICFKTSDLFVGVSFGIITGLIVGVFTGLFGFSDIVNINYSTYQLSGILSDGLSSVIDIIVSTIMLYGLISIAMEGEMMAKCCDYILSMKFVKSAKGAETVIAVGVGIVNILLAGCVLPSILMFKDVADTIGQKAGIPASRRSILLTTMSTNITAIIPINSAFVMGAVTVINQLAAKSSYLPVTTPIKIFVSSYYCLILTIICILWVGFGFGRKVINKKSTISV